MAGLEARIDELEVRLTHHDKTIAELNEVITTQWKAIEALERQLRRLNDELRDLETQEAPPITKPPHY